MAFSTCMPSRAANRPDNMPLPRQHSDSGRCVRVPAQRNNDGRAPIVTDNAGDPGGPANESRAPFGEEFASVVDPRDPRSSGRVTKNEAYDVARYLKVLAQVRSDCVAKVVNAPSCHTA